jgi:hypothetical protein
MDPLAEALTDALQSGMRSDSMGQLLGAVALRLER